MSQMCHASNKSRRGMPHGAMLTIICKKPYNLIFCDELHSASLSNLSLLARAEPSCLHCLRCTGCRCANRASRRRAGHLERSAPCPRLHRRLSRSPPRWPSASLCSSATCSASPWMSGTPRPCDSSSLR